MRWQGRRGSSNIEDRRGMRYRQGRRHRHRHDRARADRDVLRSGPFGRPAKRRSTARRPSKFRIEESAEEAQLREFISVVLADTEETWGEIFAAAAAPTSSPQLVLFSGAVESACGFAQAAVGPFYCPADHKVYIDLSFYQDLQSRFGAPGDFAQAYVIAHESRSSRADAARHLRAQHGGAAAGERSRSERAVGAAGAAGGLLRRHLGAQRRSFARSCSKPATSRKG